MRALSSFRRSPTERDLYVAFAALMDDRMVNARDFADILESWVSESQQRGIAVGPLLKFSLGSPEYLGY